MDPIMQAEASVNLILKILCSAIKARYELHPSAPMLRRLEAEVDDGLILVRPDEEDGRFRDFHEEQMARPDVQAALGKAAEQLKSALPPGGFPFRIDTSIMFYGSRSDCSVQVEDVRFNAAGISSRKYSSRWQTGLKQLIGKLELLHEREAETMDKQAYYVIREYPGNEGFAEPHKLYASSFPAARNKALMIEAPADARMLFSGDASCLDERALTRLERLHVSPVGPSLAQMMQQPEDSPSPV